MKVEELVSAIGADFFCGVPDSQLRALNDYLFQTYGNDPHHHIIAANEGNCTALAAGYYMATGKIPVVYLQNSGEGNIINPFASLLHECVYALPIIFIIGWRGEPGVKDEPQHAYQGEVTCRLLADMGIPAFVIGQESTQMEIVMAMQAFRRELAHGKSVAFVVRKGALTYDNKVMHRNAYNMSREEAIRHVLHTSGQDPVVSTTGKVSRELFEARERDKEGHQYDFLTVGSMGHASSIALGIALNKPDQRVWCIDGDGALLMHMGALAVIGHYKPKNFIHVLMNNEAHETVGGMPTVAKTLCLEAVAKACGYPQTLSVKTLPELDAALAIAQHAGKLTFLEAKCAIGSRGDLGRPTTTPRENVQSFMDYLRKGNACDE